MSALCGLPRGLSTQSTNLSFQVVLFLCNNARQDKDERRVKTRDKSNTTNKLRVIPECHIIAGLSFKVPIIHRRKKKYTQQSSTFQHGRAFVHQILTALPHTGNGIGIVAAERPPRVINSNSTNLDDEPVKFSTYGGGERGSNSRYLRGDEAQSPGDVGRPREA